MAMRSRRSRRSHSASPICGFETDAMRWMTWKAASILERDGDATRQAQLAYTYCAENAMWIADEGVQMLGGHGYLRDNPVEMWYRDTRTVSVLEGAVGV